MKTLLCMIFSALFVFSMSNAFAMGEKSETECTDSIHTARVSQEVDLIEVQDVQEEVKEASIDK